MVPGFQASSLDYGIAIQGNLAHPIMAKQTILVYAPIPTGSFSLNILSTTGFGLQRDVRALRFAGRGAGVGPSRFYHSRIVVVHFAAGSGHVYIRRAGRVDAGCAGRARWRCGQVEAICSKSKGEMQHLCLPKRKGRPLGCIKSFKPTRDNDHVFIRVPATPLCSLPPKDTVEKGTAEEYSEFLVLPV